MRSKSGTPPERTATVLKKNLESNLLAYVAVGSATLLGIAMPTEAEVVYTPSRNAVLVDGPATSLDLNNDGIVDFTLTNFSTNNYRGGTYSVFFRAHAAQASNGILSFTSNGRQTAAALPDGAKIGSSGQFLAPANGLNLVGYSNRGGGTYGGDWVKVEYAYLGLKFEVNGEIHYGWARIKYDQPGDYHHATVYGYAYETVANQPIIAGQTSGTADRAEKRVGNASLGDLAAGVRK